MVTYPCHEAACLEVAPSLGEGDPALGVVPAVWGPAWGAWGLQGAFPCLEALVGARGDLTLGLGDLWVAEIKPKNLIIIFRADNFINCWQILTPCIGGPALGGPPIFGGPPMLGGPPIPGGGPWWLGGGPLCMGGPCGGPKQKIHQLL